MKQAVSSPLLETTIEGASHVIINISGDISLMDANDAASYVQELAGDEANIIFGAMYDDTYTDEASITVIATGLDSATATQPSVGSMASPKKKVAEFAEAVVPETPTGSIFQRNNAVNPTVKPMNPSLGKLKTPESNVPVREIQIPDFLRRK